MPEEMLAPAEDPAVIEHPVWCAPTSCTVTRDGRGFHFSRAIELAPMPPSPVTVAIQVSQGLAIPRYPMSDVPIVHISFTGDQGEDLCAVPLYLDMARALSRVLLAVTHVEGR